MEDAASPDTERVGLAQGTQPILIHFRTRRNLYIYDASTNQILRLSPQCWKLTKRASFWHAQADGTPSQSISPKLAEAITFARQRGLFSDLRPNTLSLLLSPAEYRKALRTKLSHLVLGVTEQCNLRCAYCTYSGHYEGHRIHTNATMSPNMAMKAVDFFLERTRDTDAPCVGFYGGEPTLNISTIVATVEHIDRSNRPDVLYNMTTNGCSLSDRILRFLVQHRFSLLVSLDGLRQAHDRFRLTVRRKGTFDAAYRTLERLRALDESYFRSSVRISVVITPPFNVLNLKQFFDEDPLFEGVGFSPTIVSGDATTFFNSDEALSARDIPVPEGASIESLRKGYLRNVIAGFPDKSPFLSALFRGEFLGLHRRRIFPGYGNRHYANGVCIPGVRRVFVSPAGKIYVCEKVDDSLCIGNIWDGFDVCALNRMVDHYIEQSNRNCTECYANRLCTACFATSFSVNGFREKDKAEACDNIRASLVESLIGYCEVLEENPSAFDFMKDIHVE